MRAGLNRAINRGNNSPCLLKAPPPYTQTPQSNSHHRWGPGKSRERAGFIRVRGEVFLKKGEGTTIFFVQNAPCIACSARRPASPTSREARTYGERQVCTVDYPASPQCRGESRRHICVPVGVGRCSALRCPTPAGGPVAKFAPWRREGGFRARKRLQEPSLPGHPMTERKISS